MLIVLNTRNAETGHLVDKIFLLQIIIFPTLDFNCSGPGGIDGRARQRRCKKMFTQLVKPGPYVHTACGMHPYLRVESGYCPATVFTGSGGLQCNVFVLLN